MCRTCHIQYDGKSLNFLRCLLHFNVVSMCHNFVIICLPSLWEQESAMTLGVLDVDGKNGRLNVKKTHTLSYGYQARKKSMRTD